MFQFTLQFLMMGRRNSSSLCGVLLSFLESALFFLLGSLFFSFASLVSSLFFGAVGFCCGLFFGW